MSIIKTDSSNYKSSIQKLVNNEISKINGIFIEAPLTALKIGDENILSNNTSLGDRQSTSFKVGKKETNISLTFSYFLYENTTTLKEYQLLINSFDNLRVAIINNVFLSTTFFPFLQFKNLYLLLLKKFDGVINKFYSNSREYDREKNKLYNINLINNDSDIDTLSTEFTNFLSVFINPLYSVDNYSLSNSTREDNLYDLEIELTLLDYNLWGFNLEESTFNPTKYFLKKDNYLNFLNKINDLENNSTLNNDIVPNHKGPMKYEFIDGENNYIVKYNYEFTKNSNIYQFSITDFTVDLNGIENEIENNSISFFNEKGIVYPLVINTRNKFSIPFRDNFNNHIKELFTEYKYKRMIYSGYDKLTNTVTGNKLQFLINDLETDISKPVNNNLSEYFLENSDLYSNYINSDVEIEFNKPTKINYFLPINFDTNVNFNNYIASIKRLLRRLSLQISSLNSTNFRTDIKEIINTLLGIDYETDDELKTILNRFNINDNRKTKFSDFKFAENSLLNLINNIPSRFNLQSLQSSIPEYFKIFYKVVINELLDIFNTDNTINTNKTENFYVIYRHISNDFLKSFGVLEETIELEDRNNNYSITNIIFRKEYNNTLKNLINTERDSIQIVGGSQSHLLLNIQFAYDDLNTIDIIKKFLPLTYYNSGLYKKSYLAINENIYLKGNLDDEGYNSYINYNNVIRELVGDGENLLFDNPLRITGDIIDINNVNDYSLREFELIKNEDTANFINLQLIFSQEKRYQRKESIPKKTNYIFSNNISQYLYAPYIPINNESIKRAISDSTNSDEDTIHLQQILASNYSLDFFSITVLNILIGLIGFGKLNEDELGRKDIKDFRDIYSRFTFTEIIETDIDLTEVLEYLIYHFSKGTIEIKEANTEKDFFDNIRKYIDNGIINLESLVINELNANSSVEEISKINLDIAINSLSYIKSIHSLLFSTEIQNENSFNQNEIVSTFLIRLISYYQLIVNCNFVELDKKLSLIDFLQDKIIDELNNGLNDHLDITKNNTIINQEITRIEKDRNKRIINKINDEIKISRENFNLLQIKSKIVRFEPNVWTRLLNLGSDLVSFFESSDNKRKLALLAYRTGELFKILLEHYQFYRKTALDNFDKIKFLILKGNTEFKIGEQNIFPRQLWNINSQKIITYYDLISNYIYLLNYNIDLNIGQFNGDTQAYKNYNLMNIRELLYNSNNENSINNLITKYKKYINAGATIEYNSKQLILNKTDREQFQINLSDLYLKKEYETRLDEELIENNKEDNIIKTLNILILLYKTDNNINKISKYINPFFFVQPSLTDNFQRDINRYKNEALSSVVNSTHYTNEIFDNIVLRYNTERFNNSVQNDPSLQAGSNSKKADLKDNNLFNKFKIKRNSNLLNYSFYLNNFSNYKNKIYYKSNLHLLHPTYKLYFIIKNKNYSYYFTDFYSLSNVISITVRKPYSSPTRVAVIEIENKFNYLRSINSINEDHTLSGLFDQLISPDKASLFLKAGGRIQIRKGYNSILTEEDVIFNGEITQVKDNEEILTIVASSYTDKLNEIYPKPEVLSISANKSLSEKALNFLSQSYYYYDIDNIDKVLNLIFSNSYSAYSSFDEYDSGFLSLVGQFKSNVSPEYGQKNNSNLDNVSEEHRLTASVFNFADNNFGLLNIRPSEHRNLVGQIFKVNYLNDSEKKDVFNASNNLIYLINKDSIWQMLRDIKNQFVNHNCFIRNTGDTDTVVLADDNYFYFKGILNYNSKFIFSFYKKLEDIILENNLFQIKTNKIYDLFKRYELTSYATELQEYLFEVFLTKLKQDEYKEDARMINLIYSIDEDSEEEENENNEISVRSFGLINDTAIFSAKIFLNNENFIKDFILNKAGIEIRLPDNVSSSILEFRYEMYLVLEDTLKNILSYINYKESFTRPFKKAHVKTSKRDIRKLNIYSQKNINFLKMSYVANRISNNETNLTNMLDDYRTGNFAYDNYKFYNTIKDENIVTGNVIQPNADSYHDSGPHVLNKKLLVAHNCIKDVLRKYYNGLIVLDLDETIENGDEIYIKDSSTKTNGVIEVGDVQHILNNEVGAITIIRPLMYTKMEEDINITLSETSFNLIHENFVSNFVKTGLTILAISAILYFFPAIIAGGIFIKTISIIFFLSGFNSLFSFFDIGTNSNIANSISTNKVYQFGDNENIKISALPILVNDVPLIHESNSAILTSPIQASYNGDRNISIANNFLNNLRESKKSIRDYLHDYFNRDGLSYYELVKRFNSLSVSTIDERRRSITLPQLESLNSLESFNFSYGNLISFIYNLYGVTLNNSDNQSYSNKLKFIDTNLITSLQSHYNDLKGTGSTTNFTSQKNSLIFNNKLSFLNKDGTIYIDENIFFISTPLSPDINDVNPIFRLIIEVDQFDVSKIQLFSNIARSYTLSVNGIAMPVPITISSIDFSEDRFKVNAHYYYNSIDFHNKLIDSNSEINKQLFYNEDLTITYCNNNQDLSNLGREIFYSYGTQTQTISNDSIPRYVNIMDISYLNLDNILCNVNIPNTNTNTNTNDLIRLKLPFIEVNLRLKTGESYSSIIEDINKYKKLKLDYYSIFSTNIDVPIGKLMGDLEDNEDKSLIEYLIDNFHCRFLIDNDLPNMKYLSDPNLLQVLTIKDREEIINVNEKLLSYKNKYYENIRNNKYFLYDSTDENDEINNVIDGDTFFYSKNLEDKLRLKQIRLMGCNTSEITKRHEYSVVARKALYELLVFSINENRTLTIDITDNPDTDSNEAHIYRFTQSNEFPENNRLNTNKKLDVLRPFLNTNFLNFDVFYRELLYIFIHENKEIILNINETEQTNLIKIEVEESVNKYSINTLMIELGLAVDYNNQHTYSNSFRTAQSNAITREIGLFKDSKFVDSLATKDRKPDYPFRNTTRD